MFLLLHIYVIIYFITFIGNSIEYYNFKEY